MKPWAHVAVTVWESALPVGVWPGQWEEELSPALRACTCLCNDAWEA